MEILNFQALFEFKVSLVFVLNELQAYMRKYCFTDIFL